MMNDGDGGWMREWSEILLLISLLKFLISKEVVTVLILHLE